MSLRKHSKTKKYKQQNGQRRCYNDTSLQRKQFFTNSFNKENRNYFTTKCKLPEYNNYVDISVQKSIKKTNLQNKPYGTKRDIKHNSKIHQSNRPNTINSNIYSLNCNQRKRNYSEMDKDIYHYNNSNYSRVYHNNYNYNTQRSQSSHFTYFNANNQNPKKRRKLNNNNDIQKYNKMSDHTSSLSSIYDNNGYIKWRKGLTFMNNNCNNYTIICKLGQGTYGSVFKCIYLDTFRAIKIFRNTNWATVWAPNEETILKYIKENDPNNKSNCIHIIESFKYKYFNCPILVFPLYSQSLYQFMKHHNKTFDYDTTIKILYQIIKAISFTHSLMICHTDLKTENIMLVDDKIKHKKNDLYLSPQCTKIKIIDFGMAKQCNLNTKEYHLITSLNNRAPEVILELGWNMAVDVWSIGCILVELLTGKPLFGTKHEINLLHQIRSCIGEPSADYLEKLSDVGTGKIMKNDPYPQYECGTLESYFKHKEKNIECNKLYNLCKRMLCWRPQDRITAEQALKDQVFQDLKMTSM